MTIDQLDALLALVEHGTTGRAATALRITQSAVSKRVSALEGDVGAELLEKDGRRVRLTTHGARFVRRVRGPLGDLKSALLLEDSAPRGTISISVSESVLSSWGAGLLAVAARSIEGLVLQPHAHRSPVALDRVRSGDCLLALVAGESDAASDLDSFELLEEEMVLVPAQGQGAALRRALASREPIPVLTIEPTAATWRSVARRLPHLRREAGVELVVEHVVESFACAVQMARAGMANALAPLGVVRALGVRRPLRFPAPGLVRPVSVAARKTTFNRALVREFVAALNEQVARGPGA